MDNQTYPKAGKDQQRNERKTEMIRFCINNPRNLEERLDLLNRGIESRDCLGYCSACFVGRFLEVDDKFVQCDSYNEILDDQEDPNTDS